MDRPRQPMVLLADSQLLFWKKNSVGLLDRLRAGTWAEDPRAAYIGASNRDRPEFFELFQAAMHGIGIRQCQMIPSEPSITDLEDLAAADLVLLAGGDVEHGWRVIRDRGMIPGILASYYGGGVLVGVSAGAVQLGLGWWSGGESDGAGALATFQLVPRLVDVHEEPEWSRLSAALVGFFHRSETPADGERRIVGLGIPSGGGAIVHPDSTLEAVRHPLCEMIFDERGLRTSLIFPPGTLGKTES